MKTQDLLAKMKNFCAYQERSEHEVERKLKALWVEPDQITEIIETLKKEDYLDEQRFVELFVRSKVNQKRWGEKKIRFALAHHQIKSSAITLEILKIDAGQYRELLEQIAEKKHRLVEGLPAGKRFFRLKSYLYSLGYEMPLIEEVIEQYEHA